MKIVLLGDTHFGVRNDSMNFHRYYEKFYSEIFFPYLEQNQIKVVYQLGDLFDRRKYINFNSLAECKRYFFDQLKARGIQLITLLGNHDIFWKESLAVNAQSLILGEYDNITVIDKPTTMHEDNASIDLIPWICKENETEVFDFINKSKSDLCLGHFEFAGFPMHRGMISEHGLPYDMFARYERVLSGHYHTRSKADNIEYIGTPYEMTWSDYEDDKGFSAFDTNTRELHFFKNPFVAHTRIVYDDLDKEPINLNNLTLKDQYVKIVVVNKTDLYKYDRFVNNLYTKGAHEIKIIEDLSEFNEGEIASDINLEDTLSILSNYIDSVETTGDKESVKTLVKELYLEAVNMEVV